MIMLTSEFWVYCCSGTDAIIIALQCGRQVNHAWRRRTVDCLVETMPTLMFPTTAVTWHHKDGRMWAVSALTYLYSERKVVDLSTACTSSTVVKALTQIPYPPKVWPPSVTRVIIPASTLTAICRQRTASSTCDCSIPFNKVRKLIVPWCFLGQWH